MYVYVCYMLSLCIGDLYHSYSQGFFSGTGEGMANPGLLGKSHLNRGGGWWYIVACGVHILCWCDWQICSRLTSTQALVDVLMTSQLTSPSDESQAVDEASHESEAKRLCQLLTHTLSHSSRLASFATVVSFY